MNVDKLLRKYYSDGTFPVDIILIIARNDIEIKFQNNVEFGYIDNNSNNKYLTFVINEKYEKEIFLDNDLGHEFKYIATVLLLNALNKVLDFNFKFQDFNIDVYLSLVGKILIPSIFIDYLFKNKQITTLENFSKQFRVSRKLAKYRAIELKML